MNNTQYSLDDFKVVGGQMIFSELNLDLLKTDEKTFYIGKAYVWANMIRDGMFPTKWLKTMKKGTRVNFDKIDSSEKYNEALQQLQKYLDEINIKFPEIKLNLIPMEE